MKDSTTDVHKTIYNEKLKNRIVSENRDFSWHPLSFYTRMFWAHFSTLHTWPKGYWLKHYNKYFVSIQFILEGEMTVTIDKNEYVIKAGEAVVIPPGTCRLAASGTNGCRKFYFIPDGQLFYSIIRQLHFDQLAIVSGNETPELVELFWTYNSPNVTMMTIACFLLVYRIRIKSDSRIAFWLANLTTCGFGIYMIHYFFVFLGYDMGAWLHIPAPLRIPFSALIILACSWSIVALAKKALGKRSIYLLG